MIQLSLNLDGDTPRHEVQMEEKAIKRLYYSISEVSRITGLKPYVLRYWETEFAELRPSKNRAGNRIYRKSDVRMVFLIKKLLYHDKFTIEGARQKLRTVRKQKGEQMNFLLSDVRNADLLREMRLMLQEILELLDSDTPAPPSGKSKK